MKTIIVYRHTNLNNGKSYIGVTQQGLIQRWWGHVSDAKNKKGMCRIFHNAIRKHGQWCWEHEVLFETTDRVDALRVETEMIDKFDTTNRARGYNITRGGEIGNTGIKMPPEFGKQISERQRGANNPSFGRAISEDERKARSLLMKQRYMEKPHPMLGKKASVETRAKMSAAHQGEKNGFFGKRHSKEAIRRMSEDNPCKGMWGWMNPCTMANPRAMETYARAHTYYQWWAARANIGRGSGTDSLCKAFGEPRTKPHWTIIQRFRNGWVPMEDPQWIAFVNGR